MTACECLDAGGEVCHQTVTELRVCRSGGNLEFGAQEHGKGCHQIRLRDIGVRQGERVGTCHLNLVTLGGRGRQQGREEQFQVSPEGPRLWIWPELLDLVHLSIPGTM